jgi:DNA-binding response OmpR family regulator
MTTVLLVSRQQTTFKDLEAQFSDHHITTEWVNSAEDAISQLSSKNFDLFIINENLPDMTGRQLIEKALFQNAMMNSVVLSELSHDDFHETYEGLGVLMQLPLKPQKQHCQNILDHMNKIAQITRQTRSIKGESN